MVSAKRSQIAQDSTKKHHVLAMACGLFSYAWPLRRPIRRRPWLQPLEDVPSPCFGAWHGRRRTQGFFALGRLDEELLDYLNNDSWLEELALWGFEASPKEPFLSKADWHSFRAQELSLLVPRFGRSRPLQRAPGRIAAWAEALRKVLGLRRPLVGGERELLEALQSGSFGAVEAQVLETKQPPKCFSKVEETSGRYTQHQTTNKNSNEMMKMYFVLYFQPIMSLLGRLSRHMVT